MTMPPNPFENLKHLAEQGDATQRARTVGAALNAVPDLQHWLREVRQQAVQELHTDGLSYADIGKAIGTSRVRAHQIAEGRTTGRRAKAAEPEQPEAP